MHKNDGPANCAKCIHWRPLAAEHRNSYACHCIIDTGVSNGRVGSTCPMRKEGNRAKKRIPAATGKNRPGE